MFKRLRIEADADDKETIENFKKTMENAAFDIAKRQGLIIDAEFLEESNKRLKVSVEKIENGYRFVMDIDLS